MQAPSGLSFISHITINIYFLVKRMISGRLGAPTPAANAAAKVGAATSASIILMVISVNLYSLGTSVYFSTGNSPNLGMAVASISVQPAAAAGKTLETDTRQVCSAVAAALDPIRLADNGSPKNGPAPVLSATVAKGQSLWEVTRKLILESLGGDPCKNNEDKKLCLAAMWRYLDRETGKRLADAKLIPSGNRIKAGTIVIMDGFGAVSIAPPQ